MRVKRLLGSGSLVAAIGVGAVFLPGAVNAVPASASAGAQSAPATQAPLSAAQAASLSKNPTDHVIIVFKNQETSIPDTRPDAARRASADATVQAPVLHELSQVHAGKVAPAQLVNAVSATVSPPRRLDWPPTRPWPRSSRTSPFPWSGLCRP